LISAIPKILAGNKNGLPRPVSSGCGQGRGRGRGALVPVRGCTWPPARRTGRATTEAGPIMDGGACGALAISEIRLAASGTVRHGDPEASEVRSVGGA